MEFLFCFPFYCTNLPYCTGGLSAFCRKNQFLFLRKTFSCSTPRLWQMPFIILLDSKSQFTRYRSWNTRMYPVWKDGDPRFRNCWSGEALSFFLFTPPPMARKKKTFQLVWYCVWSVFEGGQVTFDLKNDGPTLTGARAAFTINLNFPPNQTVLPDGQVVWAQNCTVNGMFCNLQASFMIIDKSILLW